MLAAEYRPRARLRLSTAAWVSLGVAGTGAYLLSAFDAGIALGVRGLLGATAVVTGLMPVAAIDPKPLPPRHRVHGRSIGPDTPAPSRRVGLVGGLLAVRASSSP